MQIYRNEGLRQTKRDAGKRKEEHGMSGGIKKLGVSPLALTPAKESRGCSNEVSHSFTVFFPLSSMIGTGDS